MEHPSLTPGNNEVESGEWRVEGQDIVVPHFSLCTARGAFVHLLLSPIAPAMPDGTIATPVAILCPVLGRKYRKRERAIPDFRDDRSIRLSRLDSNAIFAVV